MRVCPMCRAAIKGRSDKKFCSVTCKSDYHRRLSQATLIHTAKVDKILHRNHGILLEVMGKHRTQFQTSIVTLELKKFNFNYITKYTINKQGKTYHHVYNFAWMRFSNDDILIIKKG